MKKMLCIITVALAFLMASAHADLDIPILGNDPPGSVADLVGSQRFITVLFGDSGARDMNLKLLEAHPDRIIVLTSNGEVIPYLADTIESITVQDDVVERPHRPQVDAQVLRAEHQRVVDRAWVRVDEIYQNAADDQDLRIHAAVCLALGNNPEAHNYLRQLAESNEIITQLRAAGALYLAGDDVSDTLLRQGLESGNRNARAIAASLSGLTGFEQGLQHLNVLFQDRAVQLAAPATRALARLGQRQIVPRVMEMLTELNEEKGEAAIFALSRLADEHVIDQLKYKLFETDGMMRFRIVRVLHNVGDPVGLEEMKRIFNTYPTLAPEAALLLAREGDWDATEYLRNRLTRREDPTVANMRYRARNAQALLMGGDPSAMAVFQDLLRREDEDIYQYVFELMVEMDEPRLITLLQPGVETIDDQFAFGACQTVIALAHGDFRERLLLYREEFDY